MKSKKILEKENKCKHSWVDLGLSHWNGKKYKRCKKCGLILEENLDILVLKQKILS